MNGLSIAARAQSTLAYGVGAARNGLLFTLCLCLISMTSVGCRPPAPAPVKRRYVQLQSLLPLHPAWRQLMMLREESTRFGAVQMRPDRVSLDLPALPSNFNPPQSVPPNRVNERQQRLAEEAIRRVARDAAQISATNEAKFRLEARAARAEMNADYKRKLGDRIAAIRQERETEAAALQKRINQLGFRVVALQTQVNAYGDQASQARDDALLQRDRLSAEVAALDAQRLQKLDSKSMLADATAAMAPELKQMTQATEDHLAARRKQLDQEAADRIALFRERLAQRRDPIRALGSIPPPPQYLHEAPLPFPARRETLQAIQNAQALVASEAGHRRADWQAQQERLLALIRSDTQQAVDQVARQQGWTLTAEGAPGASDATASVAAALRAQWRSDAANP